MSEVPRTAAEHKPHLIVLDGLRGVAALAVAAGHTSKWFHNSNHLPHTGQAVDFFFMLSGFVLLYAYEEKVVSRVWSFGRFFITRLVRLYPMIIAGAVLGFISLLAAGRAEVAFHNFLQTATTIPLLSPVGDGRYSNPPTWSLFFELVASALIFPAMRSLRGRGWLTLTCVTGALLLLGTALTKDDNFGYRSADFAWAFARAGFGFSMGALLYSARSLVMPLIPRLPWAAAAVILFASFVVPWGSHSILAEAITVGLVYPLVMLIGAKASAPREFEKALLRRSGDLSYPLYVMHWPIYVIAVAVMTKLDVPFQRRSTIFAALAVGCAAFVSWIVFRSYDKPIRERISKALKRREARIAGRPAPPIAAGPAPPSAYDVGAAEA